MTNRSIIRLFSFSAGVLTCGLVVSCMPWAQENQRDPALCNPACPAGYYCLNGNQCVHDKTGIIFGRDSGVGSSDSDGIREPTQNDRCGDNKINPDLKEVCDGVNLDNQTCKSKGFFGGTLKCAEDCKTFDTSGCNNCGNNKLDPGEECDSANLNEKDCVGLAFEGGKLDCRSDCKFNTAGCYKCGDGVINGTEKCDGNSLANATCESLGYKDGTLTCGGDCQYNTAGCNFANEVCSSPLPIQLTGSKTEINGDTTNATDQYPDLNCGDTTLGPWPGRQRYYKVSLPENQLFTITVKPNAWDAALYAFPVGTACDTDAINAVCVNSYSDNPTTGASESLVILPSEARDWIVVVDSYNSTNYGSFTLTIESNDGCESSPSLYLGASGFGTIDGNTSTADNSLVMSEKSCTGYKSLGPDLFYKLSLDGGKTYKITLKPDSDFDPMLYVFTDCAKPEETCIKGSEVFGDGKEETVIITPTTKGSYIIAVDSYSAGVKGKFTLDIEEMSDALVNYTFEDTCALQGTGDWECGALTPFAPGADCEKDLAAPPTGAHSGSKAWGTKITNCYTAKSNNDGWDTCANTNPADDSVLTLNATLPSSWASATLSFWSWEDIYLPWDWAEVRVNDTAVLQMCNVNYVAPTAWVERKIDLKTYIGKSIKVTFHFLASGLLNYSGWYIDDMMISGQ